MMNKKLFAAVCGAVLMTSFGALAQSAAVRNDAVVVCRSKQCKSARSMMTKEFLYNKLASLLKNNINRKVLFCDADPNVRVCLNDAISFDVMAGATDTTVRIPSALVVDAKTMNDNQTQSFVLDYNMELGDTFPRCQGALNELKVVSADDITIETPGFECRFTENGMTVVNASYDVDYIDFDYGILGVYYTLAVGQVSKGGKNGYALLRFANTGNGNNEINDCDCGCDDTMNPPCQCEKAEPEIKTVIQEKVVTQYEVAPIEVSIKTKAPIEPGQVQNVKVNGVEVPNVPVVVDTPLAPASAVVPAVGVSPAAVVTPATPEVISAVGEGSSSPIEVASAVAPKAQILKPGVPVVMAVEEDVAPGQVKAVSNWNN